MQLLILFLEFFKIGLFSVGGGLATLPFLYDLADKYPWLSAAQIPDMIAIPNPHLVRWASIWQLMLASSAAVYWAASLPQQVW